MKIGVIGAQGRVGSELVRLGCIPMECDVTNRERCDSVESAFDYVAPDIVVNLAAISDVEYCQLPEHEKEVFAVNVCGAMIVGNVAETRGVPFVFLSTDHVFDGKRGPYKEKDKRNPINQYGLSKFEAEAIVETFDNGRIVRTSKLFGWKNAEIVDFISGLRNGEDMEVPTFLRRSFMYVPHFASSLMAYLGRIDEMPKILHISNDEVFGWYGFMLLVADAFGLDIKLVHPRNKEIQSFAPRPRKGGLNTVLSKKLGLPQFGSYNGLLRMAEDELVSRYTCV
jgi:dTDP-4-dehydrorhamnose reductase